MIQESSITQKEKGEASMSDNEQDVPAMQRLLDNPFMLLFLGVVFPTIFYIIWGIMEIIGIPSAPPMVP